MIVIALAVIAVVKCLRKPKEVYQEKQNTDFEAPAAMDEHAPYWISLADSDVFQSDYVRMQTRLHPT